MVKLKASLPSSTLTAITRRRCTSVSRLGLLRRSFTSEQGKRFAVLWGNGDYGRLGLGRLDSQWRPAICSAFHNISLKAIACGGAHTLFVTDDGRVYATGLNDFGQLGISENKQYSVEPLQVSGLKKEIVQISAGYNHSCAITVDGELYMWGRNTSGQLGLGKRAESVVPLPTKVECLNGISIKMAALGSEHSLAISDGGEALSWGMGGSGRLGHGHESSILGFLISNSEYTPRLIKDLAGIKVKHVAAGLQTSACIDESGSVFVFGEKGIDKLLSWGKNNATKPSLISELPCSEEVACGGYHTCVLTNSGELYTWGSNENGCLGIGSSDVIFLPERVQGPFLKSCASQVSCGWKHTAAISEGKIFTWGWGGSHGTFSEDGHSSGGQLMVSISGAGLGKRTTTTLGDLCLQCHKTHSALDYQYRRLAQGHGSDVDYINPTKVSIGENMKAVQVSCGFNHTGAIIEYT